MFANGLSQKQVKELLKKYGENKLEVRAMVAWWRVLLSQFKSPLIYILVVAAGITFGLGDTLDAIVIGVAVVLNTILGFYQEMKAEKSLEALSEMLTDKSKVIRNGKREIIEASKVVPGEVCVLEIGEKVPADGVIIEGDSLSVNEAMLTGESVPVEKETSTQVYMGTMVVSGVGLMRVTKTGTATEIGKIAGTLTETKESKTPLQKVIDKLSKKLAVMVGVICLIILIAGLATGDPFIEIFTTAVAVAVSAIPEGLAVSLTVILAIGMQRILKKKSLVRKLMAAETLGSVTVICSDKTGTLTEGKMKVVNAVTQLYGETAIQSKMLIKAAVLCNDMRDPLEIGMMDWALHSQDKPDKKLSTNEIHHSAFGKDIETLNEQYPRLDEIPFDPNYKYIATLHKVKSPFGGVMEMENLLLVSGAPEVILDRCKMSEKEKKGWERRFEREAKKGRRLVGFGYKQFHDDTVAHTDIKDLKWLGVLFYEDPVRVGVAEALKKTKEAGIKVKVITGDYRFTAEAIVNQLGLEIGGLKSEQILEGTRLANLSDEELNKIIDEVVLFARIKPEQKLRIVKAMQNLGEVVAMTGDGVNDAPAIKQADIGIVVAEASAVAKETADMILLDSNFATIVEAVEEGRGIFANLKKIILYLLSDAFAEVILVLSSMAFGLPLPVTAAQILWINLIDDGLPNFALTLEPKDRNLMIQKPRGLKREILDGEMKWLIGLISLTTGLLALGVFGIYYFKTLNLDLARTMSFSVLAISTLLYVFSCKSLSSSIFKNNILENKWLLVAVGIGFVFQLTAVYLPSLQTVLGTVSLGLNDWGVIAGAGVLVIGVIEVVKAVYNKMIY